MKKIVITGGHLSPAVAVIQELEKRRDFDIYFLGRRYNFSEHKSLSFEYETVKKIDVTFYDISAVRVKKEILFTNLLSVFYFLFSFFQAVKILLKIKPKVILSFGGYVGFPVGLAAWVLKIPVVVHEQTIHPGFTNKIFSKFAKKILISWSDSQKFFPKEKTILAGNPLRKEILSPKSSVNFFKTDERLPIIYITGGSTGAHSLNIVAEKSLSELLKKYKVIHQCGDSHFKDYERIKQAKEDFSEKIRNRYFLAKNFDSETTASIMNAADIIIGRSGANTVSEIAFLAKPAIFIPLPWSAYEEQLKNAQKLEKNKTCLILKQKDLNSESLIKTITFLRNNLERYKKNAYTFSKSEEIKKHSQAAVKTADIIDNYCSS